MPIEVHPSRRTLMRDGHPFFYLADTGWEMLHRLSRDETSHYLQTRARQGFTVIQTVILAEEDGLRTPNANGDLPLHDEDPTRPNEAYFAHVDWALETAREQGLVLALLPTWGDKWNMARWGQGPEVFTPDNAFAYGEFLGARYKDADNVIWILGGDRPVDNDHQRAVIERMAAGLKAGGSTHLQTFHTWGGRSSSEFFPDAPWLDFHMWQSGHGRNTANYDMIASDYAREPRKPVLDGEPGYEDHKAGFELENGFLDDYENRKALYWALFSGACGHTYGCHAIWQFWDEGRAPVNHPRRPWREALELPGARQMHFARVLNDAFPFLGARPAQDLVLEKEGPFHVAAIFNEEKKHALVYCPSDAKVRLRLDWADAGTLRAQWFDPRSGEFRAAQATGENEFQAPGWGPDWVLIVAQG